MILKLFILATMLLIVLFIVYKGLPLLTKLDREEVRNKVNEEMANRAFIHEQSRRVDKYLNRSALDDVDKKSDNNNVNKFVGGNDE